jgi:Na+/proline symporter
MIASILAANMSTCSAFLVDSGALFTEGLYRGRLMPGRTDSHYLWVGRISGFLITVLGVLYAIYLIRSVLYTFLLTETMATFVGISVLGGILWPRANRWGALASLVSALGANFLLYWITGQRLDHWDPNVFLAALLVGIAALIAVSLLTPPEPKAAIDSFFDRLRTSSDVEDAGTGPTRPLLLVNLLHLRRALAGRGWGVFREDLVGFGIGWVLVIVLVIITAVFLKM